MKVELKAANSAAPVTMQTQPSSARERALRMLTGGDKSTDSISAAQQINEAKEAEKAIKSAFSEDEAPKSDGQLVSNEEAVASDPSAPAEETKEVEAKKEEPAEEKSLSSEYAILARKEKALRAREQQLKAKEAELKAKEEAVSGKPAAQSPSIDASKMISRDKLLEDPFSVLAELGLSYDKLTELALNAPKQEDIERSQYEKRIEAELQKLREEQESVKRAYAEQQTQAYKQAVAQIKAEVSQLVKSDESFETIRETGSINDVVELIEQTFKEDGVLLSVEDAARQVEDYLIEEAMKLARLKKVQQRLTPAQKAVAEQKATEAPKQQQLKTLTNSVGSSKQLSARERALLAFKGELK